MSNRAPFATAIVSLSVAFLSSAGIGACDNAADMQKKSDIAQAAANEKIAEVTTEADRKIKAAQLEADRKTSDMQATFAKTVEDYRHKTQADLTDLDHKITDLDARAVTATGKAREQLGAALPPIKAKRAAFAADFKSIDVAAATSWDATKSRLDQEWTDLKSLVDKTS